MIARTAVLLTAAGASVTAFGLGYVPAGWMALGWALTVGVDLFRAQREQRKFQRQQEEVVAAHAFARDAYRGFQEISEAAPVFVWIGTPDGQIDYINKAFREYLGVTEETLDWRTTVYPADLPFCEQYLADLQLAMEPPPLFIRVRRHDGKWRWMYAVSRAQGTPVRRLIGMGIDATDWKGSEQALAELLEAKQNFLAVMSHELRTPLTAILGYVMNLKEGLPAPLPPEDVEIMDRVEDAANRLLGLVEEVLLFNSLENAQERVALQAIDPTDCVLAVQTLLQPRARQLGLSIALDVTYAPKTLNTDSVKLRRCLINMVQNSLKFTKRGTITVRVSEDEKHVKFAVIDPGVGISVEKQRHVAEPFWQERQSMVREAGGLGLGLAVCHRIASLLGGELAVESQLGYGSTFTLVLPK